MLWVSLHMEKEDEINDYMPKVQGRRQRQDTHDKVQVPICTTAVGKGPDRAGKLDDHSKNRTNDMDNNNNATKEVEDRRRPHGATRAGHIQDTCPGQNRVEPSTGRGTHHAVAHATRTILATDQITKISKMVDIRANKEDVAGSVGHVETQEHCNSQHRSR